MLKRGLLTRVKRSAASPLLVAALGASSLLAVSTPREARGHGGGLPITEKLLFRGSDMLVATPYWGIFVGREGGEWRWICDEAINQNVQFQLSLSSDGQTMYATDLSGLTLSPDGGCTWSSISGTLAGLTVIAIATDPVQPTRAYAIANDPQTGAQTGVWKTEDRGQTWTRHIPIAMQVPTGIVVSADGQKVAVAALGNTTPRTVTLYEFAATGAATTRMLTLNVDGRPLSGVTPLLYEGTSLYLQSSTDGGYALHRLDGAASTTPTRLFTTQVQIKQAVRAPQGGPLLVATFEGIYQQQPDQSFKRLTTLSGSLCLAPQGNTVYACGSNFSPDLAAIAKLGPDFTTYTKVFRFPDTKGPISCPPTSTVGMTCPDLWQAYAELLADPRPPPPPVDMASSETPPPAAAEGCSYGTRWTARHAPTLAVGLGLFALLGIFVTRRRRPDDPPR